MTKEENTLMLEEILAGNEISEFARGWIDESNTTPENIKKTYEILKRIGLKESNIATHAELLVRAPETIEKNYQALSRLGLKDSKIVTLAHLLGRDQKIIKRNYQNHIGLLREDYTDRNSGRDLLMKQAQLLGINPETIEANVQYLNSSGIGYLNGLLLGTTTHLKRIKLAWMLRELFDYRNLREEQKPKAIANLYEFIRANPENLVYSIKRLNEDKSKLMEKVKEMK